MKSLLFRETLVPPRKNAKSKARPMDRMDVVDDNDFVVHGQVQVPSKPPPMLVVRNLSDNVNNEMLRELFAPFNPKKCQVVYRNNRSKGWAGIEFEHEGDAARAKDALQRKKVDGREITILDAKQVFYNKRTIFILIFASRQYALYLSQIESGSLRNRPLGQTFEQDLTCLHLIWAEAVLKEAGGEEGHRQEDLVVGDGISHLEDPILDPHNNLIPFPVGSNKARPEISSHNTKCRSFSHTLNNNSHNISHHPPCNRRAQLCHNNQWANLQSFFHHQADLYLALW